MDANTPPSISLLTSLRYYWNETLPRVHAWPLYRTTITQKGISIVPASRVARIVAHQRFDIRWTDVARVERTTRGTRILFKDERKPIVVASFKDEPLIEGIETLCPVHFDPVVRPSKWGSV